MDFKASGRESDRIIAQIEPGESTGDLAGEDTEK